MMDIERTKRASQYMSREQKADASALRERVKSLIEQEAQEFEHKYPDLHVSCRFSLEALIREEHV